MTSPLSSPVDSLRAALARAREHGRTYPAALRQQVLDLARQYQRRGDSVCPLALALGLAPTTVLAWLRSAPSPFVPVVVRDAAPVKAHLCLVLPGGARVEGLSLDDIASLCRKVTS